MTARVFFLILAVTGLNIRLFSSVTPEQLVRIKPTFVKAYRPPGNSDTLLELPMGFNSAAFSGASMKKRLQGRAVKKVTLYYSVYRLAEKFDQPLLNLQRFKNLQALFPLLLESPVVEWKIVGQLEDAGADAARDLYHGFVIELRPSSTPESMSRELSSIASVAMSDSLGKDTVYYIEKTWARKKRKWTGYYLPRSERKRREQVVYRERSIWKRQKQYETIIDSVTVKTGLHHFTPSEYTVTFMQRHLQDSIVIATLNRNRQWKNMVFVVDVTGSMSPYSNQLFVWYKLNRNVRSVRNFTFFNDGDNKRDAHKSIGKTGGVYYTEAVEPDEVIGTGTECMTRGGGGDAPENNCEALLAAQEKNPEAPELFMIADNWANMRDTALISRIKKPVHIILCGVRNNYFNTEYLNLARRTGGSVHTIDSDINDLARLSEGEKIKFGSMHYIIRKGKFEMLTEI